MTRRFLAVSALAATVLAPAAVSAQSERSSPVESYHLVQLSVNASEVDPEVFKQRTEAIRSCNDATELGEEIGADMTRNRFVRATQLPDALKVIVEELETGRATPVYSNDGQVLGVLVLCHRA